MCGRTAGGVKGDPIVMNRAVHSIAALACGAALMLAPAPTSSAESSIEQLRAEALALANAARDENGLEGLEPNAILDAAAQAHARDMARRSFYSHVSPEGDDVQDRYLDSGGSRWELVAENIAQCSGCSSPATIESVQSFQEGWMNSPPHRENILARGLSSFGFGIAGDGSTVYAVQTFAGPGLPLGLAPGEETQVVSPDEQAQTAADLVNRARKGEGLAAIAASDVLSQTARQLLPQDGSGEELIRQTDDLFGLLPQDQAGVWRRLNVLAAACGGCGTRATAADLRYFVAQWLDNSRHREILLGMHASDLGVAVLADGAGRKIAVAVVGRQ
jgi:uncharacterized protein YkwD